MDRSQVVAGVAGDLNSTEQAVDAAIAHAATLIQSMITSRTALSLSPVSGAAAQAKAMETIAALSQAREAIVACHEELARDHRRLGWGTYAVGPLNKPDDPDFGKGTVPPGVASHLRVA